MPPAASESAATRKEAKKKTGGAGRTIEELLEMYGPEDFVMGIDEAGRGPVLGPMVYGCAFCRLGDYAKLRELGACDSKQIAEKERDKAAGSIKASDFCEYMVIPLHSKHISAWMQRRASDCTLNTISHDCAIFLIDSVIKVTGGPPVLNGDEGQDLGWESHTSIVASNAELEGFQQWKKPCQGKLRGVYVDTVGRQEDYQHRLAKLFPFLHITVESKADDTFPIVGAASIMAKTTRDAIVANWKFEETDLETKLEKDFGTGYPSDPLTQKWLGASLDKVFGYPNIVRFSWGTTKRILETSAVKVTFDDPSEAHQPTLLQAMKKRRCQYFQELKLESVDKF